ncbi:MAG: helix-turn-helix domain-containing protein [Erythrobacter sp.]
MASSETYSLFMATDVACRILEIDPDTMLQTAGIAARASAGLELRVSVEEYFAAWNTTAVLSPRADYVPYLGVAIARGPVIPVFFTLSCAPDMETGLLRLAQFKSLLGPTRMRVFWDGPLLRIEYESADNRIVMPPSLGALQIVVMVEYIRGASAYHVRPVRAGFDGSEEERRQIAGHLGIMPERSEVAFVAFAQDDAKRRFISENPSVWADVEEDLKLKLTAQNARVPMAARVRGMLVDLIPTGRTGAEDVAAALQLSRSTLQRRLREENTSYQAVLDTTRRDIAVRYLTKTNLRSEEIASVLAYSDANSFSRSFRRWTGKGPMAFREEAISGVE